MPAAAWYVGEREGALVHGPGVSKKGKKWIVLAAPCMATLSFQVLTLPKPKDGNYKKWMAKYCGTSIIIKQIRRSVFRGKLPNHPTDLYEIGTM